MHAFFQHTASNTCNLLPSLHSVNSKNPGSSRYFPPKQAFTHFKPSSFPIFSKKDQTRQVSILICQV